MRICTAQINSIYLINHRQVIALKTSVCETLWPPAATKSEKATFSTKVKVEVTRSLTFVCFQRTSLVKFACKI